jgi:serine/threonine kinase 16
MHGGPHNIMRRPALAHRDIKPGNVVRGARGRVALMDLGSVAPANVYIKDRRQALALQEMCAQHCTAPYRWAA